MDCTPKALLLNKSDKSNNAWSNGVIPFTVEISFMYIDFREIIIGDFCAFGILALIKHTGHRQTFRGFCRGDERNDNRYTDKGNALPIPADEGEQAMFNFVPFACPGRVVQN
jgi:hypothetical protein